MTFTEFCMRMYRHFDTQILLDSLQFFISIFICRSSKLLFNKHIFIKIACIGFNVEEDVWNLRTFFFYHFVGCSVHYSFAWHRSQTVYFKICVINDTGNVKAFNFIAAYAICSELSHANAWKMENETEAPHMFGDVPTKVHQTNLFAK